MATNRNKRLVQTPVTPNTKVAAKGAGTLVMEVTDGLVENQKVTEIMPGYHTGTYQSIASGDQSITANYMGDTKVTTITVKPIPSKLVSAEFTGEEGYVYQNEVAEVLITFDKPLADGQQPTYRTNPNLMIATKLVLAEDLRSGTFTVMGVNVGEGKVFASLGGVDKDATITVKEAPATLTRVVLNPNPVSEGSNIEVRLVHDKAPIKENITIDVDPSFTKQGELAVEGNDAVAVYKTTTFGDYAIEAKSHKITKTVTANVNKVMPVIESVSVPESVLAGKEFTVTVTFDKEQYLNANDVEIIFDRNAKISIVEAPKVVSNTVVAKYVGTVAYTGTVAVKYLSEAYTPVSPITVRAQAKVKTVTFNPDTLVEEGKSVVIVEFDKAFEPDQDPLEATVNSYLIKSKEFTLTAPENVGGTLEVTAIKEGQGVLNLVLGGETTIHNIMVGAKAPVLENAQLGKSSLRVGEKTTLTCTFNKPEVASNVAIEAPANVSVVGEPVVDDVTISYEIQAVSVADAANITIKHSVDGAVVDAETKNVAITVVADAKAVSLTGNQSPEYKSEVEITFTADKAKVEGQPDPVFVISEEDFETVTPFAWDEGNATGKLTIKPLKFSGTQPIAVTYGEVRKTFDITPVKAADLTIEQIDLDYPSLEVGEIATLVVTTNKPIAEVGDIPVSVNEFLTYNEDAEINSDNTLTITVTAKGVGAGVVTFNPNGGAQTKAITVTASATLQSVEAAYTEVLLNTPVKCTAKFDVLPNKEKLSITPNQTSACEIGTTSVEGNNITFTVTMKQAIVCNITVGYGDITKPLAITGVDTPNPTSEITCSDVDKNVLLNSNFDLTLEFDAAPTAEKLTVELPAGVENVTPVAVSETTKLKGTYKATTEGEKVIKFTYLGVEKTITLTGTNPVTATGVTLEPTEANLQPGDEFTAKVTFSGAIPADQEATLSVDGADNLTKKDNLVVAEDKLSASQKFTINEDANDEQIITFDGVTGNNTHSFTPVAKAVLQSVEVTPESVNIGEEVTVKYTFDKAPRLGEVTLSYDTAKLEVSEEAAIGETNKVIVKYTATAEGSAEVKATHNGVEKAKNVTIITPVVMGELSVDPQTAQAGSETAITVTIPFTSGTPVQEKIVVDADDKFQAPGAVSLSGMSATCVLKPHATNNGTGTITVKYDNKETKTITVEITAAGV